MGGYDCSCSNVLVPRVHGRMDCDQLELLSPWGPTPPRSVLFRLWETLPALAGYQMSGSDEQLILAIIADLTDIANGKEKRIAHTANAIIGMVRAWDKTQVAREKRSERKAKS